MWGSKMKKQDIMQWEYVEELGWYVGEYNEGV